jgi:hypothetical protein
LVYEKVLYTTPQASSKVSISSSIKILKSSTVAIAG